MKYAIAVIAVVGLAFLSCSQKQPASSQAASTKSVSGTTAQAGAATAAAVTGTIDYVDGTVNVNGKAAQLGQTIHTNDTISTGNGSIAEITFSGRNIIQIQPNTDATINFAGAARGLQLSSGSAALVLKHLAQQGSSQEFSVYTPTAVGGVRGTAFFVKVESIDSTYVCLCNGELWVHDVAGGNSSTITAAHHKAVRFVRAGNVIREASAPLLYHDDAQMQALAKKVGYTIDWTKPDITR